jgi:hypothetical protein
MGRRACGGLVQQNGGRAAGTNLPLFLQADPGGAAYEIVTEAHPTFEEGGVATTEVEIELRDNFAADLAGIGWRQRKPGLVLIAVPCAMAFS